MPEFRLDSTYTPTADQPKAIAGVAEAVRAGDRYTTLLGATGTGKTMTMAGVIQELQRNNVAVGSTVSQFGWQFERQFYARDGGVTALNEWVFLLGGLDQGVAIPSLSWMAGLRTWEGAEFGVGPNVTPAGVALAIAAGMTIRTGSLNIPMNFAVVPSKAGTRVTMLTGFSLRR